MTKSARNLSILGSAVALIGLLLVLGPNLGRIELGPGKPDLSPPGGVQTLSPDLGATSAGVGVMPVLIRILMIAALACLAFIVVGAIFNRALRAYLLAFLVFCLLIVGAYYVLQRGAEKFEPDLQVFQAPALARMEDRPATLAEEDAVEPPHWSFFVVAIALSIGVTVLLGIVWAKLAQRWRRRAANDDRTELEEIIETVVAAADEIQLGGDPRLAVLHCYREMVRILCGKRKIDHAYMTARELAVALHRVGFTTQHVDRLTEIFELVRYGNRSGLPLAERAIGCLEAIRKAYAT